MNQCTTTIQSPSCINAACNVQHPAPYSSYRWATAMASPWSSRMKVGFLFLDSLPLPPCTLSPLTKHPCLAPTQLLPVWLTLELPAVNLNHFRLLRVVGKGAFGKVRIVERKDTGLTFALKYIRKDEGTFADDSYMSQIVSQEADCMSSGPVRKRTQHHPRTKNARTFESCLSLQFAI